MTESGIYEDSKIADFVNKKRRATNFLCASGIREGLDKRRSGKNPEDELGDWRKNEEGEKKREKNSDKTHLLDCITILRK